MSDDIRKTMTPEMESRWAEAMRSSHVRPGLRFGVASRHWDHTRTVVLGADGVRLAGETPWAFDVVMETGIRRPVAVGTRLRMEDP